MRSSPADCLAQRAITSFIDTGALAFGSGPGFTWERESTGITRVTFAEPFKRGAQIVASVYSAANSGALAASQSGSGVYGRVWRITTYSQTGVLAYLSFTFTISGPAN